jgi:hypothetical protein
VLVDEFFEWFGCEAFETVAAVVGCGYRHFFGAEPV